MITQFIFGGTLGALLASLGFGLSDWLFYVLLLIGNAVFHVCLYLEWVND